MGSASAYHANMQKPKNVVPISAGHADSDPEHFTISVGSIPFRFRMGPSGRSTMIGPARLIDFPGTDVWKELAESAQGSDECPDRGGRRARRTKVKTFTIENETDNIIVHMTIQEAEAVANAECFHSEAGLAKLGANWPGARLVAIWNSLPGATPVKKFKDRPTAVNQIWKAIQSLDGTVEAETTQEPELAPLIETQQESEIVLAMAEVQGAAVAQEPGKPASVVTGSAVSTTPEANVATPVAPHTPDVAPEQAPAKNKATRAKMPPKAATNAGAPREGSKTSQVIAMLKREGGTTLEEIMTAMDWQKHTTRAMLSAGGSLTKNHGLAVTSEKVGDQRKYSIKA
jgi:Protein of unknown function (DUF3489)